MTWAALLLACAMCSTATAQPAAAQPAALAGVHRVVFLGDSITYDGRYIEYIDAYLRLAYPKLDCQLLDLGLPSETCSGLSEPGHAGGKFPRPDLDERLQRVLDRTRPQLIVACYGMNCGIYHPFSQARFASYQQGLERLRTKAAAHHARVLFVTPPTFDPVPIKARTLPAGLAEYRQPFEGYNDVLDRYSQWLLGQKSDGWDVVDAHGPMNRLLATGRSADPQFKLAADGVHIGAAGHWLMAQQILLHWGASPEVAKAPSAEAWFAAQPHGPDVLKLVGQRQRLLKNAWLTATGHERPGMKPGLPLDEAERQAGRLDKQIADVLKAD
jgi:lysophospholipase L1-like esterase